MIYKLNYLFLILISMFFLSFTILSIVLIYMIKHKTKKMKKSDPDLQIALLETYLYKDKSKQRNKCKHCGKLINYGECCNSCYYEYHESREELDYEKE